MNVILPAGAKGRYILLFDWQTTALFSLTAILAAISPSVFRVLAITVSLVLFALGLAIFLFAYLRAIARSRYEVISVAGVYLMSGGVAPKPVRRSLFGALGVQIVVSLVTASVRPYTSLAFGVLVPLFGLAMCGLWSTACGEFPRRSEPVAEPVEDEEPG